MFPLGLPKIKIPTSGIKVSLPFTSFGVKPKSPKKSPKGSKGLKPFGTYPSGRGGSRKRKSVNNKTRKLR
jgi:hypothetical protein